MINKMNKKGQFTDLFLFMIIAVILLFVSGLFIYMGLRVNDQFDESFTGMTIGGEANGTNYTTIKNQTFGDVNVAYNSLYWISILIIVAMLISILWEVTWLRPDLFTSCLTSS